MAYYLFTGLLLGLTAGISPGPLQTLLISETIQHSRKAGILIALAPLISDLPIILIAIFIIQRLSKIDMAMGFISIAGSLYLLYLAYQSFRYKEVLHISDKAEIKSLKKGVAANFLNPHPYLFWSTVGAPTIITALGLNIVAPVFFIFGFYVMLIGTLITTALLIDKTKTFIKKHIYLWIIRFLGIILVFLAILFAREAWQYFNF
ncbi:LysE family translocator [candidate division KSB1 bacterium]